MAEPHPHSVSGTSAVCRDASRAFLVITFSRISESIFQEALLSLRMIVVSFQVLYVKSKMEETDEHFISRKRGFPMALR